MATNAENAAAIAALEARVAALESFVNDPAGSDPLPTVGIEDVLVTPRDRATKADAEATLAAAQEFIDQHPAATPLTNDNPEATDAA